MELREYLRAARSSWLLIVGTAAVVVALAAGATVMMTKQYVSTSRVFITTVAGDPNTAYQGALLSAERANSYADLASSPELSQRVISQLKLKTTADELSGQIDASVVPDTVVLKIDVTDDSAKEAQRINTAVIRQLQGYVRQLETPRGQKAPVLKATVVGKPSLPDSPSSPERLPLLAAALIVGLLLGFGLAVLREVLAEPEEPVVRAAEDPDETRAAS